MKLDYISHLLAKVSDTLTNECVQEVILNKLILIQDILRHNPDIDTLRLIEMSSNDLKDILDYYDTLLLEAYKRRNLTPIQFAKEKDGNLKDALDKLEERLKKAQDLDNKDKEESIKKRIQQVKLLIDANKIRIDRIKDDK